jgi:hypothetical protein
MSDIGQNIRELVTKGMEAIGNTASNIAAGTRQKVNEINTGARKKELYESLGKQTYIAWLNGTEFPDPMTDILRELLQLDGLNSSGKKETVPEPEEPEKADEAEAPEEQEACGEPDEPVSVPGSDDSHEIPYIEVPESDKPEKVDEPLSSAINSLFEQMPPVDQLADKVNASLDEMGEQLKKFSDHFGKQLNDMADELLGNSDHKDE